MGVIDEHALAKKFDALAPPLHADDSRPLVTLGVSGVNVALEMHPAAQVIKLNIAAIQVLTYTHACICVCVFGAL